MAAASERDSFSSAPSPQPALRLHPSILLIPYCEQPDRRQRESRAPLPGSPVLVCL
jgi:hypothetical protein